MYRLAYIPSIYIHTSMLEDTDQKEHIDHISIKHLKYINRHICCPATPGQAPCRADWAPALPAVPPDFGRKGCPTNGLQEPWEVGMSGLEISEFYGWWWIDSLDWCDNVHRTPPYLMVKTKVSGEDFPLNQSNERWMRFYKDLSWTYEKIEFS